MTISKHRLWFTEHNGRRLELESIAEIERFLTESEASRDGHLSVTADTGPRPWWHQLFGARRYVWIYFIADWKGDAATLTFMDEDGGEHLAPPLTKARAFDAMREFVRTGERPKGLEYTYTA